MAQAGAHVTCPPAEGRPSIFEVLAQESLMAAVRPALRHAIKVLAESNPGRFGALWRSFDELYLLLDVLLQSHFLSRCGASFSENFYGLKRVPARSLGPPARLGLDRRLRWWSLLLLCLAPYLRAKLEAALARQRDEDDFSIRLVRSRRQRALRAAVAAFPYVGAAWQVCSFCQQLLYICGFADSHDPLLWMARVRLAQLTARDIRDIEGGRHKAPPPASSSLSKRAWHAVSQAAGGVAVAVSTSLSLGVFFLQFLEWWYSSENHDTVKALTSLPPPPPPLHLQAPPTPGALRTCPLCQRTRTNATALATSGYVFCYKCIYAYVKANRRCPVTRYPSDLTHLIKIYSPES